MGRVASSAVLLISIKIQAIYSVLPVMLHVWLARVDLKLSVLSARITEWLIISLSMEPLTAV